MTPRVIPPPGLSTGELGVPDPWVRQAIVVVLCAGVVGAAIATAAARRWLP